MKSYLSVEMPSVYSTAPANWEMSLNKYTPNNF